MIVKLMPGLVLVLLLLLLFGAQARTEDETVLPTKELIVTNERQAHWIDYLAGVATEGEALGLVSWLANSIKRGAEHANKRGKEVLAHLLEEILEGLEDRVPEAQRKELQALRLNQASATVPWLINAKDCQGERCATLGKVTNMLIDHRAHDAQGAHDLMRGLLERDSKARKSKQVKQMAFVVALAAYDEMAAEACAPVWAPNGRQLSIEGKRLLLDGVISLLRGQVRPETVEEACRKHLGGLQKSDMNCLYALTAAGFEPVQKTLEDRLKRGSRGHEQIELQRLYACIKGRIDPCNAISQGTRLFPPHRSLLARMREGFERKCELRQAIQHITFTCPDPGAPLPLARALRGRGLPENQWEDTRRDEVWFWIYVLTQQCKEATSLWEHLRGLYEQEASVAFPMRRMDEAIKECKKLKIKGLGVAEETHGVLRLLKEGRFAEAQAKIETSKGNKKKGNSIGRDARYYYETVMLMLREHPRSLDLSDIVSTSLFRPNEYERNALLLRQLNALGKGGELAKMEVDGDDELGALLLLMAGRPADVIKAYESIALGEGGSEQPVLCEIVATAYICQGTSKHFCSPSMSVLIQRALDLLNLKPKSDLYGPVREAVCKLVEGKLEGGWPMREDTSLIRTHGSYRDVFGGSYFERIFRFPNDPRDEESEETKQGEREGNGEEEKESVEEEEKVEEEKEKVEEEEKVKEQKRGNANLASETETEVGTGTEPEEEKSRAEVWEEQGSAKEEDSPAKESSTEEKVNEDSSESEILSEEEIELGEGAIDGESQENQSQEEEYDQQAREEVEAEMPSSSPRAASLPPKKRIDKAENTNDDLPEDHDSNARSRSSTKEETEIAPELMGLTEEERSGDEFETREPAITPPESNPAHASTHTVPTDAQGRPTVEFYVPTDAEEQDFGPVVDPVTLIPTRDGRNQRGSIAV